MTSNWAYSLDLLAQNGVLDFDAPSFVMGQNPRYVGRPSLPPSPYATGIPPAPAINQPVIDEFQHQPQKIPKKTEKDNDIIHNPSWKKWTFAALSIGGLALLAFNYKSVAAGVKNGWTKVSGKISWSGIKTFCSNAGKSVCKFFSDGWNKFKGLFKKTP